MWEISARQKLPHLPHQPENASGSAAARKSETAKESHFIKKRQTLLRFKNKAGYTATPVACGWAGAVFEVT